MLLLFALGGRELVFAQAASGTDPILRQIFERRARFDAVVRIASRWIVLVAASVAHVLAHLVLSHLGQGLAFFGSGFNLAASVR